MILKIFSADQNQHPLADSKELKRVLAELPVKDDEKSVDEISGWFESLRNAEHISPAQLFEATRALDEAGQVFLRRLGRQHLIAPRTGQNEEKRRWTLCRDYWEHCAALYGILCAAAEQKDKNAEPLKGVLPLLFARYVAALAALGKWRHFRYERLPGAFWQQMGSAYLGAERLGIAGKPLQLYPGQPGATTVALEFTRFVALESSSLDSLQPLEIELAEKLIAHFAPSFVLGTTNRPDNLYWIDAALGDPPKRLTKLPIPAPSVRLLAFGRAPQALADMLRLVERGELPGDLALGGHTNTKDVLVVLRHLAAYWAAQPPLRQHARHPGKSRLFALQGFNQCIAVLDPESPPAGQAEAWDVNNISLGGFGVVLPRGRRDPLRIGQLVALQPEGGANWLTAVVRRYGRDDNVEAVGVETLSKQATLIEIKVRASSRFGAARGEPAILLDTATDADGVRVLLPAMTFDVKESYDTQVNGKATLLSPIELIEAGQDYELARFRLRYVD